MATKDAIVRKGIDRSATKKAAANIKKAGPGTIEVTARIMGEDGEWNGRTIQIYSWSVRFATLRSESRLT